MIMNSRRCKAREEKATGQVSAKYTRILRLLPSSMALALLASALRSLLLSYGTSFRRRSAVGSRPQSKLKVKNELPAMSVSLLSRRVAGLSLRSAGVGGCSPAVTAVSSLSTIAGSASGGASATTNLVSASPATAAASCGGLVAGSARQQVQLQQQQQQVRFMSKKSKRSGGDDLSNQQHEEWVKFQQSISVDGFETGQIKTLTKSGMSGGKDRGGKVLRRRRERDMAKKAEEEAAAGGAVGGGGPGSQFPALRYSDEETERLLAEAYANLPARTGKRGTRHLKRERQRWFRARLNARKKKEERIAEHSRRMEKRSRIVKEVLAVKEEAEDVRDAERQYQEEVMRAWATKAVLTTGDDGMVRQVVGKPIESS